MDFCATIEGQLSETAQGVSAPHAASNHVAAGGHTMAFNHSTPDSDSDKSQPKKRRKKQPIIGRRFGRLTAVALHHKNGTSRYIECKCDCGNTKVVLSSNLSTGKTQSCGCLYREMLAVHLPMLHEGIRKHGRSQTGAYSSWKKMVARCVDSSNHAWKDYGGRGIQVCERWLVFENFYEDMGERPPRMTIDRIDANGNYEPGNCRWATRTEQNRNKRNNVRLAYQGRTELLVDWAKELGVSHQVLEGRLRRGWTIEETLSTPVHSGAPDELKDRRREARRRSKKGGVA